jgi:flagellar biosynthesis/type III secretory pathway M-ring protein FliF/YscJ
MTPLPTVIHTALGSGLVRLAEVTPTPTPTPASYDTDQVTPGVVGFVVTFVLAILVILLVLDMVRRVRRVNYRAQIAEELDAEERERAEAEAAGRDPLAPPASSTLDDPDRR